MQHFISVSIYGLTLAWITSENSTKLLECRHLKSIFAVAGPSLLCYCLRSPVLTAPVRGSTPTLSAVPSPTACQLLCPANSHSRPLTSSGYGEISGPKILCLVSRQTNKGIVCLAGHPYSVTHGRKMGSCVFIDFEFLATTRHSQLKRLLENLLRKRPTILNKKNSVFLMITLGQIQTGKIMDFGWSVSLHPPYSPDLALSDSHLFPFSKITLNDKSIFQEDQGKTFVKNLRSNPAEFYFKRINKLPDE